MATPSAAPITALSAYRSLLRAIRIAFQGDFPVLHAARIEARKQFDQHRAVAVDTPLQIQHAVETAEILKKNVVQGIKADSSAESAPEASSKGDKDGSYELRIHEHIELGDNDTVKMPNGKTVKVDKPCS